jgi:hypothetical protein
MTTPDEPMSISQLANAFRGIPRDAYVLLETPAGLKPIRLVSVTHVAIEGSVITTHDRYDQMAIILRPEA